ncbi:glycosyltransferase family 4 protein [Cryobacterium sp. HLT2-28]|uniref:glycosyltransferase family 4 protein n=1 Tax=Cryobacterium sp. HLT2-28 TaxID=1259146 RepID=UPI00106D2157|nr:glycosyltransferase family 4 protein [Cryobacterium sp. HLT2-28]TFB91049.1 glycosyltransferase [Cryobacterium sp. HLT2-28]
MPEPRVAIAYDCLFPLNAGGGERVYRRLAELFVQRGSTVDYVTRRQWATDAPPASFGIVPVWQGEIYDAGGTRTPRSAVAFAWALFRHFLRRRGRYDLVVVSTLPVLNLFAVRLALLGSGAFVVADWLEVWPWQKWREYAGALPGAIAFLLQWLGIRLAHLHTVNSDFTGARLRRYRRRAKPVTLGLVDLVDLVELSGDEPGAGTDRPGDPYLVFIGRHIADKRLIDLIPALGEARAVLPALRAVIVGDGPETAAVAATVTELGLDSAVELRGRVGEEELRELIQGARVLVNPSAREGFGLVVVEAAAFATPSVVVAGPDNAAAELVADGVNGYVAATMGPADLGAAIVRAVQAGEPLRASTRAWFEKERVSRGLSGSIDEILKRYRSARAR